MIQMHANVNFLLSDVLNFISVQFVLEYFGK